MYSQIMIPVDLSHLHRMEKALKTGADLARLYGGTITFVGITGVQPSPVAHTPEEYAGKLSAFAEEQARVHDVPTRAHAVTAHDPAVEIDGLLLDASLEMKADLIVAATHVPSFFGGASHGGALAAHAAASVMLVRAE